ncbi:hypothetical protein AK95_16390 [Paenibacillus sp. LC231]|uniref:hypothetical protein n=1 Tax=Paenibacillus sp. LC231 TaxID=1120679 RepID=UPI0008DD5A15|nr:hypothetical protein [Paenibacillus sp. LC231]OIA98737.1 hypothetical protein AK95_16390 [Paenibacillus sp. LC231]
MKYLIVLIILFSLITAGCNNNNEIDFNQLVDSLVKAEKTMNSKELVTTTATSSSSSDGIINFRIMVEDRLTNEQAKELVFDFYDEIERGITDLNLFRKSYQINFDIKSEKDGEIIYKGQRNEGEEQIWWQF